MPAASPAGGWPVSRLVLAGVLVALVYAVACALWPFAACWVCHGDGKKRSPSGRSWRRCRWCKGTGQRLRVGRKIANYATRTRRRGSQ
jgi:hypothetical protein